MDQHVTNPFVILVANMEFVRDLIVVIAKKVVMLELIVKLLNVLHLIMIVDQEFVFLLILVIVLILDSKDLDAENLFVQMLA